jgi:hypothetical protein
MQQYWLVERKTEEGTRNLCFCNAVGREGAKRVSFLFLHGNPDTYIVTPLTESGEVVKLRVNIGSVSYI